MDVVPDVKLDPCDSSFFTFFVGPLDLRDDILDLLGFSSSGFVPCILDSHLSHLQLASLLVLVGIS